MPARARRPRAASARAAPPPPQRSGRGSRPRAGAARPSSGPTRTGTGSAARTRASHARPRACPRRHRRPRCRRCSRGPRPPGGHTRAARAPRDVRASVETLKRFVKPVRKRVRRGYRGTPLTFEEDPGMTHLFRRSLLVTLAAAVAFGVVAASAPARTTAVPRPTGEPRINGTKEVGRALTVSNGAWANKPTPFTYQWFRCDNPGKTNCQPIAGATAKGSRLGADDAGHGGYASVTACNSEGCATGASDPV